MMRLMQRLKALLRNMRINLGGRQITMAEQQLHNSQVGAVIQKVGRKRMAQCMR